MLFDTLVSDFRAGLKNSQQNMHPTPSRISLPAPVALNIMEMAEAILPSIMWTNPIYGNTL